MSKNQFVILNADDFGYEPQITKGILEAMKNGVVSSTTMIVNSPHSEAAAKQADGLAVGLHLNLCRFNALSDGSELSDAGVPNLPASFVETEAHAQLERFEALMGRRPTHLDVHKHLHTLPTVFEGVVFFALAAGLPVRSINADQRASFKARGVASNTAFIGEAGTTAFWTQARFEFELPKLPPQGIIELMCHPGYAPKAFPSAYGAQREVELATFTSPATKEALKKAGLTLVSWTGK